MDAESTGAEAGVVLTEERAEEEVTFITFVNVIIINNHIHVCHRYHQCHQGSRNLKCVDLQVVLAASVAEVTEVVREDLVVVVGE